MKRLVSALFFALCCHAGAGGSVEAAPMPDRLSDPARGEVDVRVGLAEPEKADPINVPLRVTVNLDNSVLMQWMSLDPHGPSVDVEVRYRPDGTLESETAFHGPEISSVERPARRLKVSFQDEGRVATYDFFDRQNELLAQRKFPLSSAAKLPTVNSMLPAPAKSSNDRNEALLMGRQPLANFQFDAASGILNESTHLNVIGKTEIKYSFDAGHVSKRTQKHALWTQVTAYNARGVRQTDQFFSTDGRYLKGVAYTYNARGHLVSVQWLQPGKASGIYKYVFEYDAAHRLVRSKTYRDNMIFSVRTIARNAGGTRLRETEDHYDAMGYIKHHAVIFDAPPANAPTTNTQPPNAPPANAQSQSTQAQPEPTETEPTETEPTETEPTETEPAETEQTQDTQAPTDISENQTQSRENPDG